MSYSAPPALVPNLEGKRSGEPISQASPSKRRRQDPERTLDSRADLIDLYDNTVLHQTSDNTSKLCKKCTKFKLGEMLTGETKAKCIGFLDSFNDPNCRLCDTIQHFVTHHWGSQRPSAINSHRPRVHMQSKKWCTFRKLEGSPQRTVCRIVLALDQRPPNLKLMRRALDSDAKTKFVLTELELDPARFRDTSEVYSLRRPIPLRVDLELVQSWLNECRGHKQCTQSRNAQQLNSAQLFAGGFRLIDVLEGRLVEKTEPCEYVALSYVWGKLEPPPLCTREENLFALCEPSSLHLPQDDRITRGRIPNTIADSIALCQSIGYRYLWVDSLCIIQDNFEEKRRLIHGMDCIYENASLTLVALSGCDSDAGLAGISPRSPGHDNAGRPHLFHQAQSTCGIGIGRISLEEQIRSSYWNTRAWTYQEQLLSPRKLYFGSDEVFYECAYHTRREGYALEEQNYSRVREGAPWYGRNIAEGPDDKAYDQQLRIPGSLSDAREVWRDDDAFQNIVSTYTRRSLTEPGDILNALTGIYHKYYHCAEVQDATISGFQGIPMRCFFRGLLWFTPDYQHKRKMVATGLRPSTWSWISWVAPVDFASARGARFPASAKGEAHISSEAYSLVDEWCLYFEKTNAVSKVQFSNRQHYERPGGGTHPTVILTPQFLKLFSTRNQEVAATHTSPIMPGVLEFVGPYIPAPTVACATWLKAPEREWQLAFDGFDNVGFGVNCFAVVKLDLEEDTIDGFILLVNDWSYLGLCVKRVGDYFERVGVVIFTIWKKSWEIIVNEGLLELYWKRILLR